MLTSEIRTLKFINAFELSNKYFLTNSHTLPQLDKFVINLGIQDQDSFTSAYFPRALMLVEMLSGYKSFVATFKKSLKGKKSYKISFSAQVTLRGRYLFDFIYLAVFFIFPAAENKFLKFNKKITRDVNYYFSIKDTSVLPGLLEYFFKWEYPVSFYLITLKTTDLDKLYYLCNNSGFAF
jgi:ribosomal protein L5